MKITEYTNPEDFLLVLKENTSASYENDLMHGLTQVLVKDRDNFRTNPFLETVEIGYFDMKSAEVKTREINVYYKSRKYVIAYCHLRKDMRKFRTSRIVEANILKKTYEVPKDFDKNRFL